MNSQIRLYITVAAVLVGLGPGRQAEAEILAPVLQSKISPAVGTAADSLLRVVVFVDAERPAVLGRIKSAPSLKRGQRVKMLLGELPHRSVPSAGLISRFLGRHSATPVTRLWIVPAYSASLTPEDILQLAQLPGVKLVTEDLPLEYVVPVMDTPAGSLVAAVSDQLALLKVPYLWQRGLKGAGRLICSFDTGVDKDHPALADKWRGNHTPLSSAWFSKVAPDDQPYDAVGHGTHTMGLMVGAVEADSFGVAPQAEWITAGVVDQGRPLQTTLSDIIEAFQWALDPDGDTATVDDVPDVILNSWGVPKGVFTPCDETFSEVIDVVEAAGIVTIFAAGNEGPDPMTLRSPADRATTPTNTLAVGAVDNSKLIAGFSSRGPSSCDQAQIKPEVVAPGVWVRSCQKGGGYSYMSGTSMAAPFVAGLVALMRQYNPEATVEQIKYALLQATEDLGTPGEDNDYGHGLVDASQLLDYLPLPGTADFSIAGTHIDGDGVIWPGESFNLQVVLNNPAGNVPDVIGAVECDDDSVTIDPAESDFVFGAGGSSTVNSVPYSISIPGDRRHGETLSLRLILHPPGGPVFDTLTLNLPVGIAPPGLIADQSSSRISFSVSDFAQFGFGDGSIYPAGGEGLRVDGSRNLLYEAGLIIGRSSLQLSSSIRDAQGGLRRSDYEPTLSLSNALLGDDGGMHRVAGCVDSRSELPIPIDLTQETITYADAGGVLVFRFRMRNMTPTWLTGLRFGFLSDLDLDPAGDQVRYDSAAQMIYQSGGDGPLVGLVPLKNMTSFASIDNGAGKIGFTGAEQYGLVAATGIDVDSGAVGDLMMLIRSKATAVPAWDSAEVAFALVVGDDVVQLSDNARRAREHFDLATDVDDGVVDLLPNRVELYQNYPNPFNPTTTLSFSLERAAEVSLTVYNALGQRVKQLAAGRFSAGTHAVQWNGLNDRGAAAASGVYFYRLSAGEITQTKKMLLLK